MPVCKNKTGVDCLLNPLRKHTEIVFLIAHIYLANSLTQFVFLLNKIKSFAKKVVLSSEI